MNHHILVLYLKLIIHNFHMCVQDLFKYRNNKILEINNGIKWIVAVFINMSGFSISFSSSNFYLFIYLFEKNYMIIYLTTMVGFWEKIILFRRF